MVHPDPSVPPLAAVWRTLAAAGADAEPTPVDRVVACEGERVVLRAPADAASQGLGLRPRQFWHATRPTIVHYFRPIRATFANQIVSSVFR